MDRIPAFLQNDASVYFAAANTAKGFESYFSQIFDAKKLDRLILVKGGPGTGKSTLLIRLALAARENDEPCECFLCSSDTASLDAVYLPRQNVAAVDATSPHSLDPICPGAVETIFDAGAFWDVRRLKEDRKLLFELIARKNEAYRHAYRLLGTAGNCSKEAFELYGDAVNYDKLKSAAKRLFLKTVKSFPGYSCTLRQVSAFSRDGFVRLKSFERQARAKIEIDYAGGTGAYVLSQMHLFAREYGAPIILSRSIMHPGYPEAIYFPLDRILFALSDLGMIEPDYRVNMDRFLDRERIREHRNRIRLCRKLCLEAQSAASLSFQSAARFHSALESRYVASMDFSGLAAAWERELETIFE